MPEPSMPLGVGERIAFYRRRQGLTQVGLAGRLNRSVGWVRNIEQGRRQVDSTTVILELAGALGIEPNKLTGRPLFPPPAGPKMPQPSDVLADLRRVLLHYDGLHGLDLPDDRPPRPAADLEREVQLAEQTRRSEPRNFSAVVWMLPELIRDARYTARNADDTAERRRGWGVLARLYSLTAGSLWQWGDDDLGWIAADRSIRSAEQSDDPLLIVVGVRVMQQLLLAKGYLGDVIDLVDAASDQAAPGRDARPEQLVMWGSVQLMAAFAAARAGEEAEHARLRRQVDQAADRLGKDRLAFGSNFGPGDAALQHVGELVELGQPAKAIRRAEELPADPLPQVDRRAFHRIHQAKARFLQHKDRETTELLMEAWQIAPEIVPFESMTFEMVRAMVGRARYRYNPHLRTLADLMRIA